MIFSLNFIANCASPIQFLVQVFIFIFIFILLEFGEGVSLSFGIQEYISKKYGPSHTLHIE
jgi:hypothetical protein